MAILTLHWAFDVVLVFLFILVAAYFYVTRNFKYWQTKGVVEIPPIPFFGNLLNCCLFRESAATCLGSFHHRSKGLPYVGLYAFDKPVLLLRDPDIIKSILVKDFNCFDNRYASSHDFDPVSGGNLLTLKNPDWKAARSKVSPIFTAVKMKKMFPVMLAIGDNLVTHLDNLKLEGDGRPIEVKDICARYTTDVITTCAFGLQDDSLKDTDSRFRKCGISMLGFTSYTRGAEFAAFFFAPAIAEILRLTFFSKEASNFMRKIFRETVSLRAESNIYRNDFIDLLMNVKKSQEQSNDPHEYKFDEDKLVGQATTFFAAGFETSASTISFTLYELSRHPDIQSRLREEMLSALAENDGKITYETLTELPYLDMVVSETLRKYPPLPLLDRIATRDYNVPGTDLVIEKGTPVYMPLFGLHYDPEFFPEPEKYDPERFSTENKRSRHPYVYMPFGEGPRNCIGIRFGLLMSKLGLLKCILNYEFTVCAQTPTFMDFEPKAFLLQTRGGIVLHVRRITT